MNQAVTLATFLAFAAAAAAQDHRGHSHAPGEPCEEEHVVADASEAPRFSISHTEFDFGRIPDTHRHTTEISFTNAGPGVLKIMKIDTTCGCTVPELPKREYLPGESGVITVHFDPHNRRGAQNREVTIFTNDPQAPRTVLTIKAEVLRQIEVNPPIARLGEVLRGQTRALMIDVIGRAPGFEVTNATITRGEGLSLEVMDTEDVDVDGETLRQATLFLTLEDGLPIGPIQGAITIRMMDDSGNLEVRTVAVVGEVVGDMAVAPNQVNFGVVSAGGVLERHLTVESRTATPFRIIGVKERPFRTPAGDPRPEQLRNLSIETFDAKEEKLGFTYLVRFNAELVEELDRNFFTEVVLLTNREDEPEVAFRVLGRIRPAQDGSGEVVGPAMQPAAPGASR